MGDINRILDSLNSNQKEAVYTKSKQLLCLAGAGTGKTHTLISRILYTTEVLKADPQSILALTFTNNAGCEMQSRFSSNSSLDSTPFFGTFHSFCYKLLIEDRNIRNKLGYEDIPSIIDESQEAMILNKAKLLCNVKLPSSKCKITYCPSSKEKFEFQVLQKTIDKLLKQQNSITFDRLCYYICDLFSSNDVRVEKYVNQYKYVYVDEFQDTDPLQWKFVKSFLSRSNIFLVGDIRQCIYQFRGANSNIIKSLVKDNNWEIIQLTQNYRSTVEICDYANQIASQYNDDIPVLKLQAYKHGEFPQILDVNIFLTNLLQYFNDSIKNSVILCRTNKEVSYLCSQLDKLGIKYTTKRKNAIEQLVKCAVDDNYRKDYLLSLLSNQDQTMFMKLCLIDTAYNPLKDLELRFPEIMNNIDEIKELDEYSQIRMLYNLGELRLQDISNLQVKSIEGLYVGTIHSVKGLEFDSVFVYGINSPTFKIHQSEELMNLYYVACTRAISNLTLIFE